MSRRIGVVLAVVALTLSVAGAGVVLHQRGGGDEPISSAGGEALHLSPIEGVTYFLQGDPVWATETLGAGGETMAAAGCTVSSLAMGLSALGYPLNPGEMRAALEEADGFTDSGQVIWSAVGEITHGAVRIGLPPPSYEVIDAELSEGRPVVVKILLSGVVPHWVLLVGKQERDYLAMDPLNRQMELVRLSDRSAAIEAVRVFQFSE